jgi:hypothetical protein
MWPSGSFARKAVACRLPCGESAPRQWGQGGRFHRRAHGGARAREATQTSPRRQLDPDTCCLRSRHYRVGFVNMLLKREGKEAWREGASRDPPRVSASRAPSSDFPRLFIAAVWLVAFSARCEERRPSVESGDLSVPIHQAPMRAEGLRPRGLATGLTMSPSPVLPSVIRTTSADRILRISRLNGSPTSSPVNASKAPLRTPLHDSGLE